MKIIFKIARLELSLLFYSPIAWFMLVVFTFQCGLDYSGVIDTIVTAQGLQSKGSDGIGFLTNTMFCGISGLYSGVLGNVYLYLPLLTMGLISREINNGTVKLLYSSPVKISQIIFGKFLAMMIYNFLLIGVLIIFLISGLFQIEHLDTGLLISGLLGIYLLLCAYTAIGLFMSCLSSYQVVAAISTFVVFAALSYVGKLWQDVDLLRSLTFFLSINGRARHFIDGLISMKDVFYFMLIIFMFLGFSILKLKFVRETRTFAYQFQRYILLFCSVLLAGFISSLPGLLPYFDATATKTQTLTANSQKIMAALDDQPLQVTSYVNLLDGSFWQGRPDQRNADFSRWEPFIRFKPDIRLKYVYFYGIDSVYQPNINAANPGMTIQQIAARFAKTFKVNLHTFKTAAELEKTIDLRPEGFRYTMLLDYGGKKTFLRLFNDPMIFPNEKETDAALKRLIVKPPKIYFLQGELERSIYKKGDRDMEISVSAITNRYSLVNQGFDVDTLSLETGNIPADISALVIADPKAGFSPVVLSKLEKYINNGGNLLIAGEPGKQNILNPILKLMDVQLMDGTLVQPTKDYSPDLITPVVTNAAGVLSKDIADGLKEPGNMKVSMPGVAALVYGEQGAFDIKPLLRTSPGITWNKKGKLVVDSANVEFSSAEGDIKGPLTTALSLTRMINGKQQRIAITGDADFLSNAEANAQRGFYTINFYFNTGLFGWFSYAEFPIDTSRPPSADRHLNLSDNEAGMMRIFYLWILPGVLVLFSMIFLIRRKRQ